MRALITGINGFVGGHLAEHLLANNWEVWGVGRQPRLALAPLRRRVAYLSYNLEQRPEAHTALAQARPDAIFHLAGQAFVPRSFDDPAGTLATNIFAQLNLLLALIELRLDARVLVSGSNEEYGRILPEHLPVDESVPLAPVSPYAVSKVAQDLLALQYHHSHGVKAIRARSFNHIGPRQDARFAVASFARQIARIEAGLQPPTLHVGNLTARRDFTDVRDMVRAYALAVEHGVPGEAYNIGSGQAVSLHAIVDTLLAQSRAAVEVVVDPARFRPVDIPEVVCDATRFRAATGWRPTISLDQTLRDILDDWRERVRSETDG
ncbi:MAG: GDP-mannose 4,6-dehydratase [Chloroflexales bacterium]|nr:GDP-mannose 4,6-dehydratase [Chloroflexales bacterium]